MRELAKVILPTPWLRRARALLTSRNQRRILRTCRQHKDLRLSPVNRVEHYYHFIFDLALPLSRLIEATPSDVTFVLDSFGVFTERLLKLFPGRVRIAGADEEGLPVEPLLGMNGQFVELDNEHLIFFKQHVLSTLAIRQDGPRNKVLLIERMPPSAYFLNEAVKRGAGASRRSITNHDEFMSALRERVKPPWEFHNLQLENLPFEEQVRYFDDAAVVIAQHGAGLANCIWMRPGATVVELSHDFSLQHFSYLSAALNLRHVRYKLTGNHVAVDISSFLRRLEAVEGLRAVIVDPNGAAPAVV